MGAKLYIVGIVIWILGLVLAAGNITGLFPTFPYAGFTLTGIGALIQWLGSIELKQEQARAIPKKGKGRNA